MPLDGSTAITIGGVNCWDEGTSEDFSTSRSSMGATRRIRCAWLNRFKVVAALQSSTQQVGLTILVVGGAQYPDIQNFFVDNIHIDGEGVLGTSQNNMVAYQWAVLTIKYMPLDYAAPQSQIDFGKDVISLKPEQLQFSGGGTVPAGMALPIPVISYRQSRYNLPSIPIAAIVNATLNPLNSVPIFGAAAKCVLFEGGRSTMRWVIANGAVDPVNGGQWNFDVEYCFLLRPIPWDKMLGTDGTFKTVQRKNGSPLLGSSDLNALFQ